MSGFKKILLSLLVLGLVALVPAPSRADTWTVTSLADDGSGGTLREAIGSAGAEDTIKFAVSGTITLDGAELVVDKDLTISGPGAGSLTIDADGRSRVFRINSSTVEISYLTITGGSSSSTGGGIYSQSSALTLVDCVVTDNHGRLGGGLGAEFGSMTLTGCVFSDNSAIALGAGILGWGSQLDVTDCTLENNGPASFGGGITTNGGPVTISGTTFNSNEANSRGGGWHHDNGTATVSNSTFYNNSSQEGGAIYAGAVMTVTDCTITGNSATGNPAWSWGGGAIFQQASVTVSNTIISGNGDPTRACNTKHPGLDSGGYNLVDTGNNCDCGEATDIETDDAGLGSFDDHGGPTKTIALNADSPAVDAGDSGLTIDQRGFARPSGKADDIGAFEYGATGSGSEDSPDSGPPPGGPKDRFGGHEDDIGGLIPTNGASPESFNITSAIGSGTDFTLIRNIPFSLGQDQDGNGLSMPALVFTWVTPDGTAHEEWLGLDTEGTLSSGPTYTCTLAWEDTPYVQLTIDLTSDFLKTLAAGEHLLTYQMIDADGNASNLRWEYLTIGQDVEPNLAPTQAGSSVEFKLMVSTFSVDRLTKVHNEAAVTISSSGEVVNHLITHGSFSFRVPFGETTSISIPTPVRSVRWEIGFNENGILYIIDLNDGDRVSYFELPDGGYAVEYYRNQIYVSNQGDPFGPTVGCQRQGG